MGLSRLDNFIKSVRGNIIYVDPNSLDATDSIENQGNSLTRPFKTIQRSLIEASRFSYQRGLSNDRFGKTTILLYPGDHIVDNRPGWIPDGPNNFRLRNGATSNDFPPFDLTTSFDSRDPNNQLYKLNSIHGGVIIPRGTSIVGLDLRKTKIRPLYVPNPTNDNIERSCIFRVTGGTYLWQFSMFDADPNGICYIDYTNNQFVPNFSHHKLSCFEYADGVNPVNIKDEFYPQGISYDRTDLEMYYEKVGLAYGQSSGRPIEPDYPSSALDIQPKIDEYRIVGSTGESIGITSIRAGDGVTSTKTITVTTINPVPGLDVDTPFRITGITALGYNGQFVVSEKLNETEIQYELQIPPENPLPTVIGAILSLTSDTVTSASPYIFNVSLRSVYGMCGVLADGDRATGFKSMVIAQFTGIGLQKDDNAFVVYDKETGSYQDSTISGNEALSTNSRAIFKPEYRNFHIKAINDAFIQNVSVFAIGYAEHFVVESGGDMSITNSNSNFGSKALVSSGFRRNAFSQDDQGYITHIIPPKEFPKKEVSIEFDAIDVNSTIGISSAGRLYIYNQTNSDVPPENVIEGYRIGARENDNLNALISIGGTVSQYSARIVMSGSETSGEKYFYVGRSIAGVNSITNNTFQLEDSHTLSNGESIRILSGDGNLPDGIDPNTVYYAITEENAISGLTTTTQIKIAKTRNDAVNATELNINNTGGKLSIVSRVSDKIPGDAGHPIQFDFSQNQWHINVSTASTENTLYSTIVSLGSSILGSATPRTYINRIVDNRNSIDTIYRVRYVIPSSAGISARPPSDGFIIQESNTTTGPTTPEIQTYFGSGSITDVNQLRNFKFIANATWDSNDDVAEIRTELPHNLTVGSQVEILNIRSTNNTTGEENSGFNGTFLVTDIVNSKQFRYSLINDPGTFTNNTASRTVELPYLKRKKYNNTYYIFRTEEAQRYINGEQDGIYYLTLINASNNPTIVPFRDEKFSQPVKELYPQVNRDNPQSDPEETKSFASPSLIGEVIVNDVRKSITKETINKTLNDADIGIGITNIQSSSETTHMINTAIDHGFNRATRVDITNSGSGYLNGDYYNVNLVGFAGSTTGQHATAKISIDGSGSITNIKIMDGGSSYGIGNTLTISGIGTNPGFTEAVLTVTQIYNNVSDVVKISGVSSESYIGYNTLYRITDVPVGSDKSFTAVSSNQITGFSTNIGSTLTSNSIAYLTGKSIPVSSISYDNLSGISTITTIDGHGLNIDNKIRIVGANQNIYNGDFIVAENVGLTTFVVNIGVSTSSPTATGSIFVYRKGLTSNEGVITRENENLNGRMIPIYAGITTSLSLEIEDPLIDEINVLNIQNLDLNIGDYLMIDDEIVRVKTTVSNTPTNPIYVFRGVLGTRAVSHRSGSVIRKIRVEPIELRRHSIMRASGHTFEYVGYGPGNYSTAFPDKQDRQITSQEELLAQSTRKDGGINFFSGMNDKGISYSGNKKLNTVTGQEEIFDTPVQTVTGEDIGNLPGLNVINPIEGNFTRSIRIEGGSDGKAISEFNGPVVFTNKVTSISNAGLEANSLFLQGNATVSRKYTLGTSEPILAGNPGDIVYYDNPTKGGYVGWIYTADNDWYRFGNISISKDLNIGIFDAVGISTNNVGNCKLRVGSGTSLFCVDSNGVGIGITSGIYKLNVNGTINGIFVGDGSGLTGISVPATGWTNTGSKLYSSVSLVGVGNINPQYNLHLGTSGTNNVDLYVANRSIFNGTIESQSITVNGTLSANSYNLGGGSGTINAASITASTLTVGNNVIRTTATSIGVGTATPRANLDIEGSVRFKSYFETVVPLTISSGNVNVDLSQGQTFTLTVNAPINTFTVLNPPPAGSSTTFTILITQNSVGGNSVNIDAFRTSGGSPIPVYWPGGGVLPIVTSGANRSDMYSFKTFDGGSTLYGVVGGQNFA
jgi:hypothetical protein